MTGARYSLEGQAGIYKVYHQGSYSRRFSSMDWGAGWRRPMFPSSHIPAAGDSPSSIRLSLVKKHDLDPAAVESVMIWLGGTYGLLGTPLEVKARPRNVVDGQFSVPWCVARQLPGGR